MQRAVIILCALAFAALGWLLGSEHRRYSPESAKHEIRAAPPTRAPETRAPAEIAKPEIDVQEVFARIKAEFPDDHQECERVARLFAVFRDLGDDEFGATIANLSSARDWSGGEAARLLAGYWAERNLPAARQWVLGVHGKLAGRFCGSIFATWAQSDLIGMLDWVESQAGELPTKGHREEVAFEVAKAAWRLDPERGMRLVRRLEPDGRQLWNLYHEWAKEDPAAASARVLQETDEKIRENVLFSMLSSWAPQNASAARAWAETIPDALLSEKAVVYVGSVIGWQDPRRGADYLVQVPQTNEAREALKETVGPWAERDLAEAFAWAVDLQDTELGDWIADAVTAKLPKEKRAEAERRWRELREAPSEKGRAIIQ